MNMNLIIKEWKEKLWITIFALVVLIILTGAALAFANQRDVMDALAFAIQLFLLPPIAVLLGASAFSAEFKDGSWAYLFSRPIKKSTIWLSKFAALAALLAGIILLYTLLLPLIPGLRERFIEFGLWGTSVFVSFSLFIVAYSLSYLTEKQFLVVFLSIFIPGGLSFIVWRLMNSASSIFGFTELNLSFLIVFSTAIGCLVFAAASLFAFCRTDFSRPKAIALGFLKAFSVFLVAGVVLIVGGIEVDKKFHRVTFLQAISTEREPVFQSNRGTFRYDPVRDRLVKLMGAKKTFFGMSVEANSAKIAWIEESLTRIKEPLKWFQELWIMDADGGNRRAILKTSEKPDSPLNGDVITRYHISPDGRKLILITRPIRVVGLRHIALWSLDSDGTGLKAYPTEIPGTSWIYCLGWSSDNRRAFIRISGDMIKTAKGTSRESWLRLLSLDSGEWSSIPEQFLTTYRFEASPNGDLLGLIKPDNNLGLFNPDTLTATELISIPGIQLARWNSKGDQIAFLADLGRRLGIVSVGERKIVAERALDSIETDYYRSPQTMDWDEAGKKIAMSDYSNSIFYLRIFDSELREIKAYPIPQGKNPMTVLPIVIGAGDKFLVNDFPASRLWSFDPATEKWKKLF